MDAAVQRVRSLRGETLKPLAHTRLPAVSSVQVLAGTAARKGRGTAERAREVRHGQGGRTGGGSDSFDVESEPLGPPLQAFLETKNGTVFGLIRREENGLALHFLSLRTLPLSRLASPKTDSVFDPDGH